MPDRFTSAIAVSSIAAVAVGIYLLRSRRRAAAPTPAAAAATAAEAPPPTPTPGAAAPPEAAKSAEDARRAKERGNKRFQGKQYAAAIGEYTKAIELADSNDPEVAKFYGNRAQCHACLEQHAKAEADCDAALRIDPSYVKALARRGTAREKLGNDEGALRDFTGALLLSGMNHQSAAESVDRLVKRVAAAKAAQRLQQPMRCLPSASFIATFVDSFRDHRQLLQAPPKRTAADVAAGLAASDGAALTAERAVERAGLLVERAIAHMRARGYEAALLDWGAAVSLISPLGAAVDPKAAAASPAPSEEQRAAALSAWSAASGVPAPSLALSMLGMFLHLRGNYDDAMACYDRALELQPSAIDVLLKRSSLWFEKEQLSKSFEDFDAALALDDTYADTYCHRGQLHLLQEDLPKAVSDLKRSVQLDGGSILARIQLGMALHKNKQLSDAREVFEAAEKAFPRSADALNYHAEFLVESGDLAGAKAKFEKAIQVSDDTFALAYVNLAVLSLHADQDMPGAIERCNKAIAVDPLCETAHVHKAHLHLQAQQLRESVAAFDDAVALLRVKRELEEAHTLREAAAAQLALLTENPKLYEPAVEQQRQMAAQMMMQAQMQQR